MAYLEYKDVLINLDNVAYARRGVPGVTLFRMTNGDEISLPETFSAVVAIIDDAVGGNQIETMKLAEEDGEH
jgi:hypothetical protein